MITDTTANAMLDAITLDLASLHTAYSLTGANEVTGGSPAYAKKAITMAAAATRSRAASTAPVFDVPAGTTAPVFDVPAGTTVRFIGLWTNAGTVFRGMFPNGGSEMGFQVDLTNNRILCEAHGLSNDQNIVFIGGTPPTGLTEGTVYFVVGVTASDPDYLGVAATLGGAAIDITGQHTAACKLSKIVPETFAAQGTHTVTALSLGLTE